MNPRRLIDGALLIAVMVGGVLAWRAGGARAKLGAEYRRLADRAGDLPVGDKALIHLMALETNEPMHFAWRVYLPPNYRQQERTNMGTSGTSWSSNAREFIARVRFREDEKGVLRAYTRMSGSSSSMAVGDPALAALVRGRWDKLRVEQLGANRLVELDPTDPAVLLRVALPNDLCDEARKVLAPDVQKHHVPVLFELGIGPESPQAGGTP